MTIEEKYKTLSELNRIKFRPTIYIGNVNSTEKDVYILDESDGVIKKKAIEVTDGITKLCDEVLSNSVDFYVETNNIYNSLTKAKQKTAHRVTEIIMTMDDDGNVSVFDDGGIPVEYHTVNKCYVPQMILSEIGTGANYNDLAEVERLGAGLNGLGAKLANIFSEKFSVDTCDGVMRYQQTWSEGMTNHTEPIITTRTKKMIKSKVYVDIGKKTERTCKVNVNRGVDCGKRGTKIDFKVDMSYFSEDTLTYGIIKILEKKCILACAANIGLKITFNGITYQFKSFDEYVRMYGHEEVISGKVGRWEYALGLVDINQGGDVHGIINSAECSQGTHVKMANDLIRGHLKDFMLSKHKMTFSADNLSNQYQLFLNCSVNKPLYDSQTKQKLATNAGNFDGKESGRQKLLPTSYKEIEKSKIIANLIELNELNKNSADAKLVKKQDILNKKTSVRSIEKLRDASLKDRSKCDLYIAEGASASNSWASASLPHQGCYSLKGKPKNVYGLPKSQVANNKELNDFTTISGLRYDGKHDFKKLRYGRFIIAADADVDGIAITGLFIGFIFQHYPEIIENGMLFILKSPLYKLYKGDENIYLYSQEEFDKAKKKGYGVEYFKGLGSLTVDDYANMLANPRLVQVEMDDEAQENIDIWLSQKDKKNDPRRRREELMRLVK